LGQDDAPGDRGLGPRKRRRRRGQLLFHRVLHG